MQAAAPPSGDPVDPVVLGPPPDGAVTAAAAALTAALYAALTRLGAAPAPPAAASIEDLLARAAAEFPQPPADRLADEPHLAAALERCRQAHGRWIALQEQTAAAALLAAPAPVRDGPPDPGGPDGFGAQVYGRVADLFERIDFTGREVVVMVGCGPLPGTLIHVLARTGIAAALGLDRDPRAVAVATALARHLGLARLHARVADGRTHDYAGADLVYVANLVRHKTEVLARVAATVRPGTPVVLRDPAPGGWLLAEPGSAHLDPRLVVTGEGPASTLFRSRHLFLVRC
ncbi:class I SAM-dependent methyltransferase [Candidatus Thiodictyon syntrophicum]|jgi:hypothetical protein|uniref:Uncharacterized protein n=1 Tax=Candidatus Thiodictyon syntrophicum TaxID=1166950 RepID=A0A2K8UDR0_9GAMM|nr:class I SAM-dependent methyltransferase [Candidatus Thiodictyon syntrophicum]AUB83733.1 hypothetical protein THSYN_24105 [Candidatus Thiodictyon syntrophicum]